jgi:hypothetical protein
VYRYAPASKDQTQSHLHSHQVNAKSTGNSTRGLPASRAGSQHVRKEGVRVSNVLPHATGAANLPHRLCCKPADKTSAKKAYEYPTCSLTQRALQVYRTGCVASRLTKRPQRRRTSIQSNPPRNGRFKSASLVGIKRPFSGPTAAGVCPCNDSRKQWY